MTTVEIRYVEDAARLQAGDELRLIGFKYLTHPSLTGVIHAMDPNNNHLVITDVSDSVIALIDSGVEPWPFYARRTVFGYKYIHRTSTRPCDCGAGYTSMPDHHSEWCSVVQGASDHLAIEELFLDWDTSIPTTLQYPIASYKVAGNSEEEWNKWRELQIAEACIRRAIRSRRGEIR